MAIRIFISKGSAATTEQRAFVDAVLEMLEAVGFSPRIMGENEWSFEQPLRAIRNIIKECDGTVVIAFTRTKFEKGIELKRDQIIPLNEISLPTTWNHIEAAMAYTYEHPLFVIAENGLKPEGLIEDGYDWQVYRTDFDPEVVKTDSFKGVLKRWKHAVEKRTTLAQEPGVDLSKISIGKLFGMISVPQLWKLIGILLTILTLIAGGSYKLGAGKWPWQAKPNVQMHSTKKSATN